MEVRAQIDNYKDQFEKQETLNEIEHNDPFGTPAARSLQVTQGNDNQVK